MEWDTDSLVPTWVGKGDLRAEWLQRLGFLLALGGDGLLRGGGRLGCRNRHWLRGGFRLHLGLAVEAAHLELSLVLLQDALIVVLPELFGGIFSGDSLEDLLATCVL